VLKPGKTKHFHAPAPVASLKASRSFKTFTSKHHSNERLRSNPNNQEQLKAFKPRQARETKRNDQTAKPLNRFQTSI
jgi:hypothetical protein